MSCSRICWLQKSSVAGEELSSCIEHIYGSETQPAVPWADRALRRLQARNSAEDATGIAGDEDRLIWHSRRRSGSTYDPGRLPYQKAERGSYNKSMVGTVQAAKAKETMYLNSGAGKTRPHLWGRRRTNRGSRNGSPAEPAMCGDQFWHILATLRARGVNEFCGVAMRGRRGITLVVEGAGQAQEAGMYYTIQPSMALRSLNTKMF